MNPLAPAANTASLMADYGLINAQRRRPEEEPGGSTPAQAEAEQAQQTVQARAPRQPEEPALTSPSRAEEPAMLQGVLSQISASSQWKLADLQPVSTKSKLVAPAYV